MTPIEQAWADLRAARLALWQAQVLRARLTGTPTKNITAIIAANVAILAARVQFLLKRAALAALLHP